MLILTCYTLEKISLFSIIKLTGRRKATRGGDNDDSNVENLRLEDSLIGEFISVQK